jgi:hypothetical protein
MSPIKTCETPGVRARLSDTSALTIANNRGLRKAALLAGASLIVIAAPDRASACSGLNVPPVNTPVPGPILGTGGSITVLIHGVVNGGPTGVNASDCSISTLTNSGSIGGGTNGAGVANNQTIGTLTNHGKIVGGSGGGAGVLNGTTSLGFGTIPTLTNFGIISGGAGLSGGAMGGVGGPGVVNDGGFWQHRDAGQ